MMFLDLVLLLDFRWGLFGGGRLVLFVREEDRRALVSAWVRNFFGGVRNWRRGGGRRSDSKRIGILKVLV